MASAQIAIHRTDENTYHPDPGESGRWVVRDARGFAVVGPPCDRCGACECEPCECHGVPVHERGCVGLSFAYVRLDSWQALCEPCAASKGLAVVACTCEPEARLAEPESSVPAVKP